MLSSNAGRFVTIYSDNTDNLIPSFNCEVKEFEVKENSCSFESVQDAFAPRYAKGNIGSNGSKAFTTYCQNIKTVLALLGKCH